MDHVYIVWIDRMVDDSTLEYYPRHVSIMESPTKYTFIQYTFTLYIHICKQTAKPKTNLIILFVFTHMFVVH